MCPRELAQPPLQSLGQFVIGEAPRCDVHGNIARALVRSGPSNDVKSHDEAIKGPSRTSRGVVGSAALGRLACRVALAARVRPEYPLA